jgi:hypothetical protein
MDLVGCVQMTIVKNNRTYCFVTPLGASYEESSEVAQEFVAEVNKLIADMKEPL